MVTVMAEEQNKLTDQKEAQKSLFDPSRVITSPDGRAIAELYGTTDEQAAAVKQKVAEKFADIAAKNKSAENYNYNLDQNLDILNRRVASASSDNTSISMTQTMEDKENGTKLTVSIGNTRADKAGGTDYTLKIIAIIAVVIVIAIFSLK